MIEASAVAGAILTGGRSVRMGQDKAFVEFRGIPMVARVHAALIAAGIAPVAAIGGDAEQLRSLGIGVVDDEWPGEGPVPAIITALRWSRQPYLCVVACDLAEVGTDTFGRLMTAMAADTDVVLARTDRLEPLCGIWRRASALPLLQSCFDTGERAVHRVVAHLSVVGADVDAGELANVNSRSDVR
jgi:molybdenum cofactor guanylyltransferase